MEQAFRYRIYPTPKQEVLLRRTMAVRGWSTTERWQRERKLGMNGKSGLIKTSAMLTSGKAGRLAISRAWLAVPLQQGLEHQQTGIYQFFCRTCQYPNFKRNVMAVVQSSRSPLSDGGWAGVVGKMY